MSEGKEGIELLMRYVCTKENASKSLIENIKAIPRKTLKEIIRLFEIAKNVGPVSEGQCPACNRWGSNGVYEYNSQMTFLGRCKQVLIGA